MNWILTKTNSFLCLETGTIIYSFTYPKADLFGIQIDNVGLVRAPTWEFDTEQERDIAFRNLYNKLGVIEMDDIQLDVNVE